MNTTWYEGITLPENAKADDRVWTVYRFHNRVTNRRIGGWAIKCGAFSPDIVFVGDSKDAAYRGMLEHRQHELQAAKLALENAKLDLKRVEWLMNSALDLAAREGISP